MRSSSILFGLMIACLAFTSTSCEKETSACDQAYEIQDYTGLDGCGLVLVPINQKNGRVLEPMNLGDFNIDTSPGRTICIDFEVRTDLASICMVGDIVTLSNVTVIE